MFCGAALIFAGVMIAALYALKQNRRGHQLSERGMLVGGGLIFPGVTLLALLVYALVEGQALLADPGRPAMRINAESRQFVWEFSYPANPGVRTINVLHLPEGKPVDIHVTSQDVIHSFWIPRLSGKIDSIPGRTNVIRIRADEPGVYVGLCAEFCGIGHTQMRFNAHVHPRESYQEVMQRLAVEESP
jgi:cytochrome c oxidase subunit 2